MSKLTNNWGTVRLVIYSGIAVVCGGLVLAGIITEDQSSTYLGYIGSGLGALGVILASANVQTKPTVVDLAPTEYSIQPVDAAEIAKQVGERWNLGLQQVQVQASSTVAEARAEAERRLGQTF